MLFLLRPRQTRMPFALPRDPQQQRVHNEQLDTAYSATRRVGPVAAPPDRYAQLKAVADLHREGVLTDAEFAAEKAKLLGAGTP